jgi:hypothetical protein
MKELKHEAALFKEALAAGVVKFEPAASLRTNSPSGIQNNCPRIIRC